MADGGVVDVAWHELGSRVNADAMQMALAVQSGQPYERTRFRSASPAGGPAIIVSAPVPEWAKGLVS